MPSDTDSYVHRIGRVGRAGREGVALTLAEPREHRLLRNFEQATRQKIEIAQVPSVADLQARRLELTRETFRETLLAGNLDGFRVVVESLADEFDLMDIATAGIKLAHEAASTNEAETEEIPTPVLPKERPRASRYSRAERTPQGPRKGSSRKPGPGRKR